MLKGCRVITIEPEETFRHECLRGEKVKEAIGSYFLNDDCSSVTVEENSRTAQLNDQFRQSLDDSWHSRLMRAYAVQVTKRSGDLEVHLVVAKSIGLGWNAYQAYFAARCLTPFIRKPLGLRYGCLFSEWAEASGLDPRKADRSRMIESIATYVAARVNGLRFLRIPLLSCVRRDCIGDGHGRSGIESRIQLKDRRQRQEAEDSGSTVASVDFFRLSRRWKDGRFGVAR